MGKKYHALMLISFNELADAQQNVWNWITNEANYRSGGKQVTLSLQKLVAVDHKLDESLSTVGVFNQVAYFKREKDAKTAAKLARQEIIVEAKDFQGSIVVGPMPLEREQ